MSFAEADSKVAASSFSFPPPADPLLVGGQFEKKDWQKNRKKEFMLRVKKGQRLSEFSGLVVAIKN